MEKIHTVTLPDIGEGVMEGQVIEWLKQVNDPVKQDEPVVVVMTDKATVELPAPYPGRLAKQYYRMGETAIKGLPLYDIALTTAEEAPQKAEPVEIQKRKENERQTTAKTEVVSQPVRLKKSEEWAEQKQILALPATRELAKQLGINLECVRGTGKEGRIDIEDIKNYLLEHQEVAERKTAISISQPDDEEVPLIGIKNFMAKKMSEAKKIPHFSYFERADATRLVQLHQHFQSKAKEEGIHATYMPFFIRALSMTMDHFPDMNSSFDEMRNKLYRHKSHHIGIAMSTPSGLIVPVLKNVQHLSLPELIPAYENLKSLALSGKLPASEMKGSTITISNYGVLEGGGLWATPIINSPEVAILAISRIQKQPLVKNDALVVRDVIHLSWSFDHRVIDGHLAASVSHYFAMLIQNPASLT